MTREDAGSVAMALERRRTPRFSQVVKELAAKGQQERTQGLGGCDC